MIPQQQQEPGAPKPYRRPRRPIPKRVEGVAAVVAREHLALSPSLVRGEAIIPTPHLIRKLGRTTYRVWCSLLTLRDEKAETHPSMWGLAKASRVNTAQLKKSLTRLREFHLLRDEGFVYMHVPCTCHELGIHMHKVWLRKVYGLIRATPDNQQHNALVPRQTAEKVRQALGQGGHREGAGRPRGPNFQERLKPPCPVADKSNVAAYRNQEPVLSEETYVSSSKTRVSRAVSFNSTKKQERERKNPLKFPCPIMLGSLWVEHTSQNEEVTMPNTLQPKATREPVRPSPAKSGAAPAAPAESASGHSGLYVDGHEVDSLSDLLGAKGARELGFGGGGNAARQRFTPADMRATSTLLAQIVHPKLPSPPRLAVGMADPERLAMLKAAYRAAHSRTMRADYWQRAGKPQGAAERTAWLEAAMALRETEISPTAWARFCFFQWANMEKKGAPQTKWVWSAARIREHAAWCKDAIGTPNGSVPVLPAGRELLEAFGQLQQQLGWGRPTEVVVSEILPEKKRQRLVALQTQQHEAWQRDIDKRIRGGEWVWG